MSAACVCMPAANAAAAAFPLPPPPLHTPAPCREFLRSRMAGLLRLTIRRATALPAADPAPFSSDP